MATRPRDGRPTLIRRWWTWALLGVAAQLAPWPAEWADAVYLGATLPAWSRVTSRLVSAVPGSVSVALALLGVVSIVAVLVWPGGRRRAGRAIGWTVAALLVTFPFTFGLGYHTTPLLVGAPEASAAEQEAARSEVAELLTASTSSGRAALDGAGAHALGADMAACVTATVTELRPDVGFRLPVRFKPVPAGSLVTIGFAGFVVPWLLEPHVDAALPPASAAAVALHELAHGAGFAREAETEAVALLAGLRCPAPAVRYAAALASASRLAAGLPADQRADYVATWPAAALEDLRVAAEVTARHQSAGLSRLAARGYDAYLVSQGVTAGMTDYDRATDLLVRLLTADRPAP